jgi:hypothetical protein
MFGKIDLVEELNTSDTRVTDWKTGSVKGLTDIEKRDEENRMSGLLRQLAMYSFLLNGSSHGATSVADSRLVFLEAKKDDKNAVYSRTITDNDIEALRQDIADYMSLVDSGEWTTRACHTKLYGEGDSCPYCALAKRFGIKTEAN